MNNSSVIIDTGPLVAFLVGQDKYHSWSCDVFSQLPAPFLTCEAVLTEAYFLVSKWPEAPRRFFDFIETGLIEIGFSILDERAALSKLMHKYEDLPMSLADACLVRLAELHPGAEMLTLDAHFKIYRAHGRQRIPLITP